MKTLSKVFLMLFLFLILCCKKENSSHVEPVMGTVIDAISKQPLSGVEVSILENGPSTTTNSNGEFSFTMSEALLKGSVDSSDLNSLDNDLAVSLSLANYRYREANVPYEKSVAIELTSDTSYKYKYNLPVQLDDDLYVSSLLSENMDTALILPLMCKLISKKFKQIHSLLIYRHGKLVLEEYYFGNHDTIQFENNITRDKTPAPIQWTRKEKHYIASANKALTSTVVGIALNKFNKTVDDRISEFLPEYASYFADSNKAAVDIENCLTMTMGFKWDEWGGNDLSLLWKSDDFVAFLLSRQNNGPESEWRYCSASPNLLLKCMQNLVGGSIRQWADQNFYKILGITDYNWESQPGGLPEGAARMFMRPRDMLKVGITYLNNGVWNGTQVIPPEWVTNCSEVKQHTSSGDYSYYFWLQKLGTTNFYSAAGDGGNYIDIFPSLDMVVVITQGNYGESPLYLNQANDMLLHYIIPAAK